VCFLVPFGFFQTRLRPVSTGYYPVFPDFFSVAQEGRRQKLLLDLIDLLEMMGRYAQKGKKEYIGRMKESIPFPLP